MNVLHMYYFFVLCLPQNDHSGGLHYISTAWGPNLGIWILFGYNFNFAVMLKFGQIKITWQIAQISKSTKAYKMHGIEIFESPNFNITAKIKVIPKQDPYTQIRSPSSSMGDRLANIATVLPACDFVNSYQIMKYIKYLSMPTSPLA